MTTAPALAPGLTPSLPGDKPKTTNVAEKARSEFFNRIGHEQPLIPAAQFAL